ncbi:MAG: class I SAM-dependent methyltransferase [Bacteroidetes bacterium]|jgi:predicted O-methyltransferase YrrM|uniref:O-methyltransferase n=1 Tax=Daejeonella sp. TaxID=2805397 RepID=UPI00404916D9|nr:class I SAM-dependent methyltransferase [Bacteroidota bacterium]
MINLQLAVDYLKYRLKAKTRHGVHSPFAYRLVDHIIYDFYSKKVYADIEKLRSELIRDMRSITITDLGAGSLLNKSKQSKVSTLARNSLNPARLDQLIHRLVADANPSTIIELGTCLGITTVYLAKAAPNARVISIEECLETVAIALENLDKLHIQNSELLVGNFDELFPEVIRNSTKLDFVLINGKHPKEAILNYFKWCLPKLSENSILLVDNIYWSRDMKDAWEQVKAHPEVSVTIDLFQIGLVFVRKAQAKEDFVIRF